MKHLAYLLILSVCIACTSDGTGLSGITSPSGPSITEDKLVSYIALFNQLKKEFPKVLELVNEHEAHTAEKDRFQDFKNKIEEHETDFASFVSLNSKVGTIFSVSEANMGTYQEMKEQHQDQIQEAMNSIQAMLDDPSIPESKKIELRKSLEQTQAGKEQMGDLYEQNRKKAAKMYEQIQKKLGSFASQEEIALVNKYRKELTEAFEGISRPRIEGSL